MASFAEIRAQMNSKYGDSEEEKKRQQEQRQNNGTDYARSNFARVQSEMDSKYNPVSSIDDDYINTFLSDSRKYIDGMLSVRTRLGYKTSSSLYDSQKKLTDDLRSRSWKVRQYMEKNKDYYSEDGYKSLMSYLDDFDRAASQNTYELYEAKRLYSKFDTEDEYNKWKQKAEERQQFDENHDTLEGRKKWFAEQNSRLNALKKEKEEENARWAEVDPIILGVESVEYQTAAQEHTSKLKEIDDQIEAIELEIRNYERGNYNEYGQYYGSKVSDDYLLYSERPDFLLSSSNRDYDNPTKDELWEFDSNKRNAEIKVDSFDGEHYRDADGNIVQYNDDPGIEDKLGLFLSASDEEIAEAYNRLSLTNGNYTDTWAELIKEGDQGGWAYLTPTEIAIYYYMLDGGQDVADKFLADMKTELNRRQTMAEDKKIAEFFSEANILEKIALSAATVPLQLASGVAGTLENAADIITGNEINPYSKAHSGTHFSSTVRGLQAAELEEKTNGIAIPLIDFTIGDAYQAGMSILDSYTAIGIGGKFGAVLLATGAANSEAQRLYEQGATMGQVAVGSAAAGAAEMVFESFSIDKLINMKDAKTIWQSIANVLIQGGVEASEEGFTEITNILTNAVIMGQQSDWAKLVEEYDGDTWKAFLSEVQAVAHASFSGFLSGVGSASIPSAVSYARTQSQYNQTGKAIKDYAGGVDVLKQLANEVAGVSDSTQKDLANRVGKVEKKATSNRVGRLYEAVDTAYSQLNQGDIAKSLERKGFNSETATDIAEALVASYSGRKLTEQQSKLLESAKGNKVVQDAISYIVENKQSTMGQRNQTLESFGNRVAFNQLVKNVANAQEKEQKKAQRKLDRTGVEIATAEENASESHYEVSAEGKTIRKSDGEIVNIKGIASIEKGKMLFETENGTVDSSELDYATRDEALIYEAVASLSGIIDTDTANRMAKHLLKLGGASSGVYVNGIVQAYTYGYYGYGRDAMIGKDTLSATLSEKQRNVAYGLGEQYRDKATSKKQGEVAAKKATTGKKQGQVFFRNDNMETRSLRDYVKESGKVLEDVQETAIKTMEKLSAALGVDFYVYESYVKDGKRYYIDENGVEQEDAPNGWYDPKTGNIYIDLNAGNTGKGTMLFTVAHELTHFIRQWSPAKFKKLADFVFKHGGFKNRGAELVEAKMAKAEERGNPISYDTAYEEVVADGMESILTSGKVVEMMADIKRQDQSLWQKICDWFKNLADDLRAVVNAYRGYSPDSTEGQMVADMKSVIKQIEAIYTEGLVDASENFQSAEKNTTEDGGVKEQARPSVKNPDLLDPRSVTKDDVRKLLQDVEAGLYAENTYIPVRISTPGIVQERLFAEDLPMAMPVKKARQDFAKDLGPVIGKNVRGHELTVDDLLYIIEKLDSPDYLFSQADGRGIAVLFLPGHPNRKTVVVDFGQNINAAYMNGYDGGKYNISITAFDIDGGDVGLFMKQLEKGWNKVFDKQKEGDPAKKFQATRPFAIEQDTLDKSLTHKEDGVKNESVESLDVEVDAKTESAAPAVLKSERTWTESDYVQEREKAAKEIATAIGVSVKKAKAYIDSVNSIAKMIADDRVRLDYFSSPGRSSFVSNVEYGGSFDFSTLCKKRRLLTGTFTAIQKALPNTALTADEILDIRNRMKEKGLEVSCGLCYVEGSRANMGQFAKEFLKLYKQYYPDVWQPNMADVNTPDGIEWVRINHPECYEQYEYFWNHYGTLKPGDKNLFASQQKPKLYQLHTEYKGEILSKFNDDDNVEEKNLNGGIRLQSFSYFEIVHLIDTMQIIMDMSRVGLAGQAYTKVPDFAWALGDTGLKINLSLIAKGVDENGRLIFDDVEGMPIDEAIKLRDRYSKNVGTILVAFNDEQLLAAMADERVDFIIPFHRSQWKKSQYTAMGLPAKTKDYTYMQNEKFIKPQYHEYRGRMVRDKATNYMPNEYWDFSKSGKENAEAYLEMCARNNKRPKFYKLLQNNGDGSYSLKADGSTDGYWKLLIDFKMYDNKGKGSPQMPVKPEFNMDEATRMLNDYRGGHSNFPVSQGIVDDFVKEYKTNHQRVKYSDRDSEGNQLSTEQQEFFKNSKVRDAKGKLLVVYHGTSNGSTTVFDRSKTSKINDMGQGVYFSTDKADASEYMGKSRRRKLYSAYINIKAPFVVSDNVNISVAEAVSLLKLCDDRMMASDVYREIKTNAKDGYITTSQLANTNISQHMTDMLEMSGKYDGIIDETVSVKFGLAKGVKHIISLKPNQIKSVDNVHPTTAPDIRYQDRESESVSNRSLLANALEGAAQTDIEKQKLQEYKKQIEAISAEEEKLRKLNDQIKELSFAKGPRDMKKIRSLQDEATKTANRISTHDRVLLRLEAAKPLRDILLREKKAAYKKAEQKGRDAMAARRDRTTRTAAVHKVQKVVKELNDLLLNESKTRHVPDNMKKAVAAALDVVNMDTVGAEERAAKYAALIEKETDPDKIDAYTATMENILRQGEKMGKRLQDLHNAYEEIQESDDPDIANAYDPVIAGAIKELSQTIGNTSLRNMTIDQLSDVYDVYRMVLTRVRDANKALADNISESVSRLATMVIGEVKKTGGEHTHRAAALDPVRKFLWSNLRPVYAMEWIGSSTLTKVFNNVRSGEDTWAKDVVDARKFYIDKSKKYGYDSWDFKKKFRFESTSGIEFDLTLEQILSLYAYSKRDQAHDHLRLGGFVFDSNIETYKEDGSKLVKYKVNTAEAHQISPDILGEITGKLTKEQVAFVDEMQEYLSSVMGAKGNEVTSKMYGVKLFKEKFYFPLKSAKQFMFEQNEVSGEVKIKNSGFTNKVVAKANNPVILSNFMDVWAGHVNDMSMYHAFTLPLEDFNRVFNYSSPKKEGQPPVSVKGTIQSAYSPAAVHYVKTLITDLNGGARTDSTTGFINKMIGLFKKGAVFASLSVTIQQPSAIARATALVDTKYFIGPKVDHKRHKALWDEVKQYAPVAIIKEMGYFDTNMGKSTQDFILGKEYSGLSEKMKALVTDSGYRDEVLSKAPALADEIAWCCIWEAVKRETKAKYPGLDTKAEPFLKLCGSRFTEVIVKTQVYDSVLARSGNMRSKDTGMKMATAFMAEPTTSINMIADALLQGKRGNRKYARKAIGAVIASQILNSILVSFVYAGRDDDEDETYVEKYIGTFTGQMLDSLNPAGYIPFIKDIVSIVQGYDVERSDMAVISDLWTAIKNLSKDNVSSYRKVEGFAGSIAQIFGLPAKNIMRDARGIYQTIMSFVDGEPTTKAGIGYAVKSALPKWVGGGDVSNQNQLYEAYLSGDKAQIARVEGRYENQSAINSAIRKALRENDPRIHEAAVARNNGDISEYTRIAKAIIAEGHFSQDNVVAAINAEINAMSKGETTSSTPKASGLYKVEDFAVAISQGDQALANAIKTDIIQTAQKNGKTENEAEESFENSAKTNLKELFLEGGISKDKAINALTTYCGDTQKDAEKRVGEWEFKTRYGFEYSDIGDAYKNGTISGSELKNILMSVGGKSAEKADEYIADLDFEIEHGFAYDDRAKVYKSGQITASELKSILMSDGGMTAEEADNQIEAYDWQAQGYDGVTAAAVREYNQYCATSNVPKDVYLHIRSFSNNTNNDVDPVTGRTIYYSAMRKVMAEINAQSGLTPVQKTAIAKSLGWSDKNIRKYKLW